MLGEGLRAGLAHMGHTHRTVAYIEREAYAASVLVARMEEGSLDAAPIWPDLLTFDGKPWRGVVDCIAAGFPCQDLSLAGRRAGLDGSRSGLFFDIVDIADACGAWCLLLENVAGIASAAASVVDEAEGALEERAAARVLGELADRGWNAEWLTLPASDVGASHGRNRWFCWCWRQLDDAGRVQRRAGHEQDRPGCPEAFRYQAHDRATDRSHVLGNADQQRTHRSGPPGQQAGCAESALASGDVQCEFCSYEFPEYLGRYGCPNCEGDGLDAVADTSSTRQQGSELGTARDGNGGGVASTWTN